jgi:hypothetical protein
MNFFFNICLVEREAKNSEFLTSLHFYPAIIRDKVLYEKREFFYEKREFLIRIYIYKSIYCYIYLDTHSHTYIHTYIHTNIHTDIHTSFSLSTSEQDGIYLAFDYICLSDVLIAHIVTPSPSLPPHSETEGCPTLSWQVVS